MEETRRTLLARAYLYDDPASYVAGVEAALAALAAEAGPALRLVPDSR